MTHNVNENIQTHAGYNAVKNPNMNATVDYRFCQRYVEILLPCKPMQITTGSIINTQTKSKTQNAHKYTISSLKHSNTVKNINTNSPCALRIAAFPLPAPDPWFLFFILFNIGAFFNMSGKIRKRILLPRM